MPANTHQEDSMPRKTYSQLQDEARAYYLLCREAEALGIPTSVYNPGSPRTVKGLRQVVVEARA
jgi:hypothetical protein